MRVFVTSCVIFMRLGLCCAQVLKCKVRARRRRDHLTMCVAVYYNFIAMHTARVATKHLNTHRLSIYGHFHTELKANIISDYCVFYAAATRIAGSCWSHGWAVGRHASR